MSEVVEPPSDRPIVAFFDVDNTLLRGASLFHIAKAARRMRVLSMRDILRFCWQQANFLFRGENLKHLGTIKNRALELIAGYPVSELERLAEEVFERDIEKRLWPETVGLTRDHLAKGHQVWLISATPEIVGGVIAHRLGLTGALGTRFEIDDAGSFTGRFDGDVLHADVKAVAARELTTQLGAELKDCWAYSDSRNDLPLLTLVGHRTVVNPDAHLARYAKQHDWPILQLKSASIREARRRVRKEGRQTKSARPEPGAAKKS